MDDFFAKVIQYPRTGLTDQMLKLIESTSDEAMSFGEFVEVLQYVRFRYHYDRLCAEDV
jgi:hypothetical protein